MKVTIVAIALSLSLFPTLLPAAAAGAAPFRPPAVPLVVHDPYFSVWSFADLLADDWTRHWTGKNHSLAGMVRVDGKAFRFLGRPPAEPARQASLTVEATSTSCAFEAGGVELRLSFLTPAIPADLGILSRPATYILFAARSSDGKAHDVTVWFDASAELAVDTTDQAVVWGRVPAEGLDVLRIGTKDQPVLAKAGDDLRIDWGWLLLAAPQGTSRAAVVAAPAAREAFARDGTPPSTDDARMPRAAGDDGPVLAAVLPMGSVDGRGVSRHLILAYDDIWSIEHFGKKLRPWWRRGGWEAADLLAAAERDLPSLRERCAALDREVREGSRRAGGDAYADLCVLSFRQCLGAHKLAAGPDGEPLYFSKECFSNGCIATVDVTFPSAPFFLLYNPRLLEAQLAPVLAYAGSEAWKFPFAPHDAGTYPKANGQVYGENRIENQMPVEESGNFLILAAALAKVAGKADFALRHWDLLSRWAEYLRANGLDPGNQLCTADMFGHMPHNSDLSLKAVVALGGFGLLCDMAGKKGEAERYRKTAAEFAARWREMAADAGHTRLAHDRPGTWGMKHNLVWDRVLGLGLFPSSIGDAEVAWYLSRQNEFGLPCETRTTTSLIDWAVWCASLARSAADFEELVRPLWRYASETPSRIPLSDWFDTITGRQVGFQARSVVGGIFMRHLSPAEAGAAPLPRVPPPARGRAILPAATVKRHAWKYSFVDPGPDFVKPGFDDSGWKEGPAGFGTAGTPAAVVRTVWSTPDIWIRTSFEHDGAPFKVAALRVHYDEDLQVYLNGIEVFSTKGWSTEYKLLDRTDSIRKALVKGRNVVAARCHQTHGGQYIDVGIELDPPEDEVIREIALPPMRPLFDFPVRDTSICLARGVYHLTGTTGHPTWWKTNDGIRLWRSRGLKGWEWEYLGLVWTFERDGTWQRKVKDGNRAIWAPEIHYVKDNFYFAYCVNYGGTGLLRSLTGAAEGPYSDVKHDGPLTGEIDASLFEDEDGKVYFVWQNGKIARLKDDMTGLAEEPRLLRPSNAPQVGFEGAFLTKIAGRYQLVCADFIDGDYHCMIASAEKLEGPYGPRYLAVPHGGHNMLFRDREGGWWSTFFGNDPRAPFRERPAILPIEVGPDGRIRPSAGR